MSLEKKIRDKAEWICKHCSQVFDDFENARKHESIEKGQEHHLRGYVEMLDVKFAIKEVAQQIRLRKKHLVEELEKQPYPRTNIDSLIIEGGLGLLDWVLGLLVEQEGEK